MFSAIRKKQPVVNQEPMVTIKQSDLVALIARVVELEVVKEITKQIEQIQKELEQ